MLLVQTGRKRRTVHGPAVIELQVFRWKWQDLKAGARVAGDARIGHSVVSSRAKPWAANNRTRLPSGLFHLSSMIWNHEIVC